LDIDQHLPVIKRFALSLTQNHADADDLSQETVLRMLKHEKTNGVIEHPRTWMYQVVVNLWRERMRKIRSRQKQLLEISNSQLSRTQNAAPHCPLETLERLQEVLESFQDLPDMQRQVLYLRTVEDLSIEEIGAILGASQNNVKVNLSLARKKMRQKFDIAKSNMVDHQ
jgi:RNA polymerase sigma-70 factor (ECF subfamily)